MGMPRNSDSARSKKLQELMKEAREAAGLSQVGTAKLLGKPQSYVSKYESGERRLDVIEFIEVLEKLGGKPQAVIRALLALR